MNSRQKFLPRSPESLERDLVIATGGRGKTRNDMGKTKTWGGCIQNNIKIIVGYINPKK